MVESGSEGGSGADDGEDPIAVYKRLLRSLLDRRPSGTRQRIARAIGTHRSFVSQITNPSYKVPLPAQHVPTIMAVCHFSAEERAEFVAAYEAAHAGQLADPKRPDGLADTSDSEGTTPDGVWIPLPRMADPEQAARIAAAIRVAAAAIIDVAVPGGTGPGPDAPDRDASDGRAKRTVEDHPPRPRRR